MTLVLGGDFEAWWEGNEILRQAQDDTRRGMTPRNRAVADEVLRLRAGRHVREVGGRVRTG
jgi:hypothetical protein